MALFRGLRSKPATTEAGRRSRVGLPAPEVPGVRLPDRALVLFMTSSCLPCRAVWTALAEMGPRPDVVVVTPESATESRRAVEELASPGFDVVMSSRTWFDYGAGPAPWMSVVASGVIAAEGPAPSTVLGLVDALVPASAEVDA